MQRQWAARVIEAMEHCQRHPFKDAITWHVASAKSREDALVIVREMMTELRAVERVLMPASERPR
jgi:hypothetical protein